MGPTNKNRPLTPLEKLQSDKLQAKMNGEEAARRLNENFTYIQENGGGLILSSVGSFLLSGIKAGKNEDAGLPALLAGKPGLGDALSIGSAIMPHLWGIARPVLVAWGISKLQSLLLNKLFGKKKRK